MTAAFRSSPFRTPGVWRVALLLTAVLFTLLLLNNREYLFATKLYENADWAADSLLVREAKHGLLLHGHYSQWHFYHPGPALIDTLAAGEALFYDALHVVPTPYNGQLLALCLATTLAFSLALSICARQLGDGGGGALFFLPLALTLAFCHYGAVGVQVSLNALPAFPPILVFLCLMVSAAAVGAGSGRELPVLVVAGGWLVHNHAAQPLFVVPLALLAYGGLLAACRQPSGQTPTGRRRLGDALAAGWRVFPRAHRVAAVLLGLFILPLVLEAFRGQESNYVNLFKYLRAGPKPGHGLVGSWYYFLTFGGYDTFRPGHRRFEYQGWAPVWASVEAHWQAYALWLAALLGAPALFLAARRRAGSDEFPEQTRGRRKFLGWFYAVLAASGVLTLVWGVRQGGQLDYYNAYFNYSIYFGLALGLAAAAAGALMGWTDGPRVRRARPMLSALCWAGAAWAGFLQADHFSVPRTDALEPDHFTGGSFATPRDAALADTVKKAAATLPAGATCLLDFDPWEHWRSATAVALQLDRLGRPVRVKDDLKIMFGEQRTVQRDPLDLDAPPTRWLVVSQSADPARLSGWPLLAGAGLEAGGLAEVDPGAQHISFLPDGNYRRFAFYGWSYAGADWSWSDQRSALLAFRALPLPQGATGGVELLISAWNPRLPNTTGPQRLLVRFNGEDLGTFDLPVAGPDLQPLRVPVPAAQWQRAAGRNESLLQFFFPDAKAPADLGIGEDLRLIGGAFRSIDFRLAGSGADPVTLKDGRFADGWCGASTTFVLPGGNGGPSLLRLRGRVPAEFGFRYPYLLVCQFADGHRQEFAVERAGEFEEVVSAPPAPGGQPVEMRLLAAQTYRPSQHDTRSSDSRDLSVRLDPPDCVTASDPLLITRASGWYDPETDGKTSWSWTNGESVLSVLVERSGTVVLEADVNSPTAENSVEVLVDGVSAAVTPCPAGQWQAVGWRLPVTAGSHRVTLRSLVPAVQPPGDSRRLAFQVKELRWRLEP